MASMPPSANKFSQSIYSGAHIGWPRVASTGATQPTSAPVAMHRDSHSYGLLGGLPRARREAGNGPRLAFHGGTSNASSLIKASRMRRPAGSLSRGGAMLSLS